MFTSVQVSPAEQLERAVRASRASGRCPERGSQGSVLEVIPSLRPAPYQVCFVSGGVRSSPVLLTARICVSHMTASVSPSVSDVDNQSLVTKWGVDICTVFSMVPGASLQVS